MSTPADVPALKGLLAATFADYQYARVWLVKHLGGDPGPVEWVCYAADLAKLPEGTTLYFDSGWDRLKTSEGVERVIVAANERQLTWYVVGGGPPR